MQTKAQKILAERRKKYRSIYDALYEDPRMILSDITTRIGGTNHTTARRMKEAFEQGYISKPQIRKRSYKNTKEYIYFIRCENAFLKFLDLIEDERFIYHAKITGFCDLWLISEKKVDLGFEHRIIAEGYRSDYFISYASNHSWEYAKKKMREKVENFNINDYKPKETIKTHWNEKIEWNPHYDILYRYFKRDVRKPITPLMREHHIPSETVTRFLKGLPRFCTVFTQYYPEIIKSYEPYLYMLETDYEDFIIDLFSELPTTLVFFKVSGRLFMLVYVKRELVRLVGPEKKDEEPLPYVPSLIYELCRKGIVKYETHGLIDMQWEKDL